MGIRGFQDAQKWDLQTDSPTAGIFCILTSKPRFFRGKTYDLERRVIHVQLPSDIGLPPYLVGLCTRSVYGLADAPCRWWNRLASF